MSAARTADQAAANGRQYSRPPAPDIPPVHLDVRPNQQRLGKKRWRVAGGDVEVLPGHPTRADFGRHL